MRLSIKYSKMGHRGARLTARSPNQDGNIVPDDNFKCNLFAAWVVINLSFRNSFMKHLCFQFKLGLRYHNPIGYKVMKINQSLGTESRHDANHVVTGDIITTTCGTTRRQSWQHGKSRFSMMTSSHGSSFCVTVPLCGEFTCDWWIPLTKGQ